MLDNEMGLGPVKVYTSDNGGLSNEQIVEMALDRIIYIADGTHPAIKEQARAFKDQMANILVHYVALAKKQERDTICQILISNGHQDMANIIRRV
jgi:hypothetical protein|tara:strand:+ start:674 stop:958 length:285 start_codon:yes stop_codon:yes gene_type:complete